MRSLRRDQAGRPYWDGPEDTFAAEERLRQAISGDYARVCDRIRGGLGLDSPRPSPGIPSARYLPASDRSTAVPDCSGCDYPGRACERHSYQAIRARDRATAADIAADRNYGFRSV